MTYCDVDVISPRSGNPIAGIRNVEAQRVCDQLMGWFDQGLSVNLRMAGEESSVNRDAKNKKEDDEIFSSIVLDIP